MTSCVTEYGGDIVPGLVETSTNLGVVVVQEGHIEVKRLTRRTVDTALVDVGQMISGVWALAGINVSLVGGYGGWRPDPNSPILGLM